MNTQLKAAFEETLEARIISTVPDMPDHRFSPQFERKMKRLEGGGAPARLTPRRLFICVTVALIAAVLAASSVGAVRDFFKRFFTETFSTHTAVQSADTAEAPETIEVVYTIDVPEGFETEDEFVSDIFCNTTYINNNKHIYFSQNIKSEYDVNVNTEDRTMEYVEINGGDGIIVDIGNNEAYISWDNGEYVFEIIGNIGKSELISVAQTVQKAE